MGFLYTITVIYFSENQDLTITKPNTLTKLITHKVTKYCPVKTVNGLFWPQTEIGLTRTVNCGQGRSK